MQLDDLNAGEAPEDQSELVPDQGDADVPRDEDENDGDDGMQAADDGNLLIS